MRYCDVELPLQAPPPPSHSRIKDHGNEPTGEVISMVQYFQRMSHDFTNRLNQEAINASIPGEGLVRPPNVSAYRELEKVKFPYFGGSIDGEENEA
jgi:hypothetical protein